MQEAIDAPIARVARARLIAPKIFGRDVLRPRLAEMLDRSRSRPLSVVVAPSGSGKTTLATQWASRQPDAVAWLTLDAADNSPTVLAYALIGALRRISPGFGRDALVLVIGPASPDPAGIGATIAEEIAAIGMPLALVVDDAHELTAAPAWAVLSSIIANAGEALHLVFTSRAPLPIDLGPARLAGRLVEIDTVAMRFTDAEALDLARALGGADLPVADVAAYVEQSGGWAALLRLLLERRDLAPVAAATERMGELLVRLVGVTLDTAPAAVQRAAMWASLLPVFDAAALAAVVPADDPAAAAVGSADILALGLPMIGAEGPGGGIALHPVVIGPLRARLAATQPAAEIAAAHRRAAEWYLQAGQPIAAVRQSLAGGDEATAVAWVADAGFAAMRRERWVELAVLVEELPADAPDRYPVVAVLACWAAYRLTNEALGVAIGRYMRSGDSGAIHDARWPERRLRALVEVLVNFGFSESRNGAEARARAERIAGDLAPEDIVPLGVLVGITGPIIWMLDGPEAGLAYLEEMLAATPPPHPVVRAVALQGLTLLLDLQGAPAARAQPLLEEGAALARTHDLPLSLGMVATTLGWLALHRLDLAAAARWFGETIDDAYLSGANLWRQARCGQVMLLALQGRGDEALDRLDETLRVLDRLGVADWIGNGAAFRARIAMLLGRSEIPLAWIDATGTGTPDFMPGLCEAADLTRVRALLMQPTAARLADAETLLDRLTVQVDAIGIPKLREPIALCRALIAETRGRRADAVALAGPALVALGERDDLLTLFELEAQLGPLLAECRERKVALDTIDRMATRREALTLQRAGVALPPLNDVALMTHIAAGATFDEIARATGVSTNTVRARVRRLFRELGASSRTDAIVRARARGLLR